MEYILEKIREIRNKKGFSYENMAHDLNISTGAYRKIEMNQTKLTVERLYQIAEILDVRMEELLDIPTSKIFKQEVTENGNGYQGIENLYVENKETINKLLRQYEERIEELKEQVEFWKSQTK